MIDAMNHITRAAAGRLSVVFRSSRRFDSLPHSFASFRCHATKSSKISNSVDQESSYKAPTKWPRPSEIPWQSKVANLVNLIGTVQIPVQFDVSSDGKPYAGTVIAQHEPSSSGSPVFWIPVVFEGDLAHTAACHLKEKDLVFVAGRFGAYVQPSFAGEDQANMQLLVDDLKFVRDASKLKKGFKTMKSEERETHLTNQEACEIHPLEQVESDVNLSACLTKDGGTSSSSWRDLVRNPMEWLDYREMKLKNLVKPKHPDFKHRNSGMALWLNDAPSWVLSGLKGLEVEATKPKGKKSDDSWRSLVENPEKWWDNRSRKINIKSPDFKHKETGKGIWIDSLPEWVLSRLPAVDACQKSAPSRKNDPQLPVT